MYVRKKHNRLGSTSVVVVSKAIGKYREIKWLEYGYMVFNSCVL